MPKHENLAAALAAFQAKLPTVAKNATGQVGQNRNYKYADLKDISDAVYPRLSEHGLAFTSKPRIHAETGKFVLAFSLLHESGEREDGEFELPAGNMQQLGSALTYAKRYSLCAVTGVVPGDDDDDGHAASYSQPAVGQGQPPQQRSNGQQQPAQRVESVNNPPAAPRNATEARAQLANTCKENGWDLDVVAARFESDEGVELGNATDRDAIVRFRASLFSLSDAALKAPAAANGAQR